MEYDGAPVSRYDNDGYSLLDNTENFHKIELLAFDKGYRAAETTATFIVFKKTRTSGIVINTATTDCCSSNGMGGSSEKAIKTITSNAIKQIVEK